MGKTNWNQDLIEFAISVLRGSSTVQEAADRISKQTEYDISTSSIRHAFARRDLDSPGTYLDEEVQQQYEDIFGEKSDNSDEASWDNAEAPDEDEEGAPGFTSIFEESNIGAIPDPVDDYYHVPLEDGRTVRIPSDTYEDMKGRYSNWDGQESTINEICREFGISRQDFVKLKKAAGWTHDSSPFTDEQLRNEDTGTLAKSLARRQEKKLYHEWKNLEAKKNKERAEKWMNYEEMRLKPIVEGIQMSSIDENVAFDSFEPTQDPLGEKVSVVYNAMDAHLDQKNADGSGFHRNVSRWLYSLWRNDNRVQHSGHDVDEKVIIVGSDMFNVDTYNNTTANGTPQDNDLFERKAVRLVSAAGVQAIDMVRDGQTDVIVRVVAGNHDRRSCYHFALLLEQKFGQCEDVTIKGQAQEWQFDKFGTNFVLYNHGDGVSGGETKRSQSLSSKILANSPSELAGCKHFYGIIGHRHYIHEKDEGVHAMQGGSTAEKDNWHVVQGYISSKPCQTAYIFAHDGGVIGRPVAYPDKMSEDDGFDITDYYDPELFVNPMVSEESFGSWGPSHG